MKALIQRVAKASVEVDGEVISSIQRGICVFIGIHRDDTEEDKEYIAQKLIKARLWDNEEGRRWTNNIMDMQYEILCVSQFTLYHTMKGNKPDYRIAMPSADSEKFYQSFLQRLRQLYKSELVQDGRFGAMMQVQIQNDGPATFELESSAFRKKKSVNEESSET